MQNIDIFEFVVCIALIGIGILIFDIASSIRMYVKFYIGAQCRREAAKMILNKEFEYDPRKGRERYLDYLERKIKEAKNDE